MGEVYTAHDQGLDRIVAIKFLSNVTDSDSRMQLMREARSAAALNHPHICTVHEIGDAGGRLFIVMEHVEGQPLSALVAEGMAPSTAIRYGAQIADALAHAHERGIVHRDLKSANLMITSDGQVKMLDFGLATLTGDAAALAETRVATKSGTLTGTPGYMAPELLRGARGDRRSDIWALGVVLYEMVSGRCPFGGDTLFEITSAILHVEPNPLPSHVPSRLRAVISKCLAKDPALRYQQAVEVRAALETIDSLAFEPPSAFAVEKSVIVLPFANLSPDADDAYFSDGLTDELITDLSRIAGLRVVPGAASFRLKTANKDLATIAREFNVGYIVEGRVRKAGQNVRITAQLVDISEDRTVWADKYTGDLDQVFEVQERVSRAIADALQLQLRPMSRVPKPDAVEAYLKGRHFARQATSIGFQRALECFRHATDLDPNYAQAFAALADVYVDLTTAWDALPALETMPKAQAAALRALDLDPSLPEAHAVRALVAMFYEWDRQTAEREFTEALRLNPNYADAHKRYATFLIWLDPRYDEALDHIQRAARLDPIDPWIQAYIVFVHSFRRDYIRAVEQGRRVIALEPLYGFGHYALGCALLTSGQTEEAIGCFKRGIELDGRGSHHVALLGMAYAIVGQRDKAFDCLAELDTLDMAGRNVAMWKLHVYVGLGAADQVIQCLEAGVAQRNSSTLFMLTHPYIDFVRRDPRFVALLHQIGFGYLATRTWQPEWRLPL
jgi:serine/threonine protein kinase